MHPPFREDGSKFHVGIVTGAPCERTASTDPHPELQKILDIDTYSLPVIWDADFLYGPKTTSGDDAFVLCEINASSTFAFPEFAMPKVAKAAIRRVKENRKR
jgi:hypothetical protein